MTSRGRRATIGLLKQHFGQLLYIWLRGHRLLNQCITEPSPHINHCIARFYNGCIRRLHTMIALFIRLRFHVIYKIMYIFWVGGYRAQHVGSITYDAPEKYESRTCILWSMHRWSFEKSRRCRLQVTAESADDVRANDDGNNKGSSWWTSSPCEPPFTPPDQFMLLSLIHI